MIMGCLVLCECSTRTDFRVLLWKIYATYSFKTYATYSFTLIQIDCLVSQYMFSRMCKGSGKHPWRPGLSRSLTNFRSIFKLSRFYLSCFVYKLGKPFSPLSMLLNRVFRYGYFTFSKALLIWFQVYALFRRLCTNAPFLVPNDLCPISLWLGL